MGKSKNNHLKLRLYNKVYEYNLNTLDGLTKLKDSPWVNDLVSTWEKKYFDNYENNNLWVEYKDSKDVTVLRVNIVFCKRTENLVDIKRVVIAGLSDSIDFEYSAFNNKYGLYTMTNPLYETICTTRKSSYSGVLSKELDCQTDMPQNFKVGCNQYGEYILERYSKSPFGKGKEFCTFSLAVISE